MKKGISADVGERMRAAMVRHGSCGGEHDATPANAIDATKIQPNHVRTGALSTRVVAALLMDRLLELYFPCL
ncbi:hypothetical protein AYO41_04855 [Verrucomicrobia bacterium SCGC AG-212-E04]|nr:hypothetical protein AYO41_04855 [Verrucomicrobia bacterium SCGC AG-212-E04]